MGQEGEVSEEGHSQGAGGRGGAGPERRAMKAMRAPDCPPNGIRSGQCSELCVPWFLFSEDSSGGWMTRVSTTQESAQVAVAELAAGCA